MRDVAVATMTLVREAGEERLVRRALERLAAQGLPVFVADGGSRTRFVAALAGLPGVRLLTPSGPGLVHQVRASLRAAAEHAPVILYTEPDKEQFFRRDLGAFLEAAEARPDAAVVVASRSPASLETFPRLQRRTEAMASELTGELLGQAADYFYGPFLVRRELVPHLDRVTTGIGWGWRPFLFVAAHRSGYAVRHLEGEFPCPPGQAEEGDAEHAHRLRQLSQNVAGLVLASS